MSTTALTNSFGRIRHGRVWFTTSPEELKRKKKPAKLDPRVVIRRRCGQPGEIVRRRP